MILDFEAWLAEMPVEVSAAVRANIQQTIRERADKQDSKDVESLVTQKPEQLAD